MNYKITNLGWFTMRLRESGYIVTKLDINYSHNDPREWTIVIDPGTASVFCTLYKNANKDNLKESQLGEFYFELYDGGQFLPNMKYKTSSIEVILEYLNKHGITHKSSNYPDNVKQQYNK